MKDINPMLYERLNRLPRDNYLPTRLRVMAMVPCTVRTYYLTIKNTRQNLKLYRAFAELFDITIDDVLNPDFELPNLRSHLKDPISKEISNEFGLAI